MSRRRLAHEKEVTKLGVVFEPEEGGWHVFIPSIQGCRTSGRSLAEARRNIREALDANVGVNPDAVGIVAADAVFDEDVRLPVPLRAALKRYEKARGKAEAEAVNLKAAQNDVARALSKALSLRDAGELIGLSHQGVRNLLKAG